MLTSAVRFAVIAALLSGASLLAAQDGPKMDAFRQRLRTSTDIAWLEQIALSEVFLRSEWRKTVLRAQWNKNDRAAAYARLGEVGTSEAIDAIGRIEAGLRNEPVVATHADAGSVWTASTPGTSDQILDPPNAVAVGNREYAVYTMEMYGPYAPYLMSRDPANPTRWTRPMLVNAPVPESWSFDPSLTIGSKGLVVRYDRRARTIATAIPPAPVDIDVGQVTRDSDRDGWTDVEERQMGLNPAHADSDDDGIADGRDVSPLHRASADEATDEDAAILRRAVFATYALTGSRWAVFVRPGSRALQLYGHSGPVIFNVDLPTRDGRPLPPVRGGAQAMWSIATKSADAAVVSIVSWSGISFKSESRVELRKIAGEWVVVGSMVVGMR